MRGPALPFPPKIWEIGPCVKHCGDFKTGVYTCAASKFPSTKDAGLGRIPSILEIGTVLRRHSLT